MSDEQVEQAWAAIRDAFSQNSPEAIRAWLVAPSGWLGGRRPIDVMKEDPEAVVRAAQRTAETPRW